MKVSTLTQLAWFCAEYHSGQWSRGYRLFCMAQRALVRRGFNTATLFHKRPSNLDSLPIYSALVAKYGEKI